MFCFFQVHPNLPHKPLTAYLLFYLEKHKKIAKKHPEMNIVSRMFYFVGTLLKKLIVFSFTEDFAIIILQL